MNREIVPYHMRSASLMTKVRYGKVSSFAQGLYPISVTAICGDI